MNFRTELQTSLRTELSPQMIQSLALLPMSAADLKNYILKEAESNPALVVNTGKNKPEGNRYGGSFTDSDLKQQLLENSPDSGETLSSHLLGQLGETELDPQSRKIGEMLIGNLNPDGFHIVPLQVLFEKTGFRREQIEKTLDLVRSFDPCGTCTADYRESLVVQAGLEGFEGEELKIIKELVYNRLQQLQDGNFRQLARELKCPVEDIEEYFSFIKTLNPFPGRSFDNSGNSYIIPELSFRENNGMIEVKVNNSYLPELEISPEYSGFLEKLTGKEDSQTVDFIRRNVKEAKNLIARIRMRQDTLQKTADALAVFQAGFFLNGPEHIETLTLRQVADTVGVHETTISRLARNKYIDTDWGIFPMKYLFGRGVSGLSRNSVKSIIAELLKSDPGLSDSRISELLSAQGIKCARRTVAKYRTELGISSLYGR